MNQIVDLVPAFHTQGLEPAFESKARRREKSLVDSIMIAFHSACDLKDYAVAWRLLQTLENALSMHQAEPGFDKRRAVAVLVAGHERLWNLRHD